MATKCARGTKAEWFQGDLNGSNYTLPVYDMNGHKYVVDAVQISKLEVDKEAQPRKRDEGQVAHLAASIKKKVLMQPLLVRYDKARDVYLITEGQHRFYACKALGIDRVPCIVYLDMDKALALLCGIEANAEDRAKALSGGDMAAKAHSIIEETKRRLRKTSPEEKITESRVLLELGHGTKGEMRKYLVSYKVKELLDNPDSLLPGFVADRQDQNTPITTKNLIFFLRRLMRTEPAEEKDEALRKDETANLVRITNYIVKTVLAGKWNPNATGEKEKAVHLHAKNICRRHPFEALGELCAEILKDSGGAHPSGGAAFCKGSDIDWKSTEQKLTSLLQSHVWDEPSVSLERSVNEILRRITAVVNLRS
jgi:ParB/RepB/Spo0J family partition protein